MPRVELNNAEVGIYAFDRFTASPVAQYEIDVSTFRDPGGHPPFKTKSGKDAAVQAWIEADPKVAAVKQQVELLVADQLDAQKGKWITIAFRDHHGKYISAALTEIMANRLSDLGYKVSVVHFYNTK